MSLPMDHPEMNGFFALLKPAGLSSAKTLDIAKKILQIERAGFLGTLDLPAAGILPVAVGHATKLISFLPPSDKEYIGELVLGLTTVTDDLAGEVIETRDVSGLSREAVDAAIHAVAQRQQQIPPHVSAKHQNGIRGYKAVRSGKRPLEFSPVSVQVKQLTVLRYVTEKNRYRIYFRMTVTPGFYVRAFCRDVGAILECGGCMGHLLRTKAYGFEMTDAMSLAAVQKHAGEGDFAFITWGEHSPCLLSTFGQLPMAPGEWTAFSHGISVPYAAPDGEIFIVRHPDGVIAGIASMQDGRARPLKVFCE